MQGIVVKKRDAQILFGLMILTLIIVFGFGYFFGRYEQIVINKSLLQVIPDVQTLSEAECPSSFQ